MVGGEGDNKMCKYFFKIAEEEAEARHGEERASRGELRRLE